MHIIVCVDDRLGLAFNHRRQSKDTVVTERIIEIANGRKIHMTPYSAKLFPAPENIVVSENPLAEASNDDLCFIECIDPTPFEENFESITIFRWNRHYPSDTKLTLDLSKHWLDYFEEFPGNSHEKITMEVYRYV